MQITAQETIQEKFRQLVKGLSPLESRIALFEYVRDIPYFLVPQIEDPHQWAASIVGLNKASCTPKHYLLGILFVKSGIPVKYATYPFHWAQQPLNYPKEIKELTCGLPVGYHAACHALLNEQWVLIDATWDSALAGAGFAVNADWDGISPTPNAVVPIDGMVHNTLKERAAYVKEQKALFTEEEKARYTVFVEKFNAWLVGLRKK